MVGALQGSLILGLVDPAHIGGVILGGAIGGVTAISAELIGRIKKKDVTANQKVTIDYKDTEQNQRHIIVSKVKEGKQLVPLIQVPDAIIELHLRAFNKATGRLKKWRAQTQVADHIPGSDSRSFIHYVNLPENSPA